jgi:predicted 3-demethylubiquinone-9 3-methyltransferase (glyoxalase superfamily)
MDEPEFKNKLFESKNYHFEDDEKAKYYKILSIRKNKNDEIQSFKVQRYEFKLIKTIVVPIDNGINKEFKIQDVYELQSTYEDPFPFVYLCNHWYHNCRPYSTDRLLNDNELTKYVDRQ